MCVHGMYSVSLRPEGDTGSPRAGVAEGCEILQECWESNPSLLQEQPVSLTIELSLQPLLYLFFQDRVSPCSSGCPGIHYVVGLAGLELKDPPNSAF